MMDITVDTIPWAILLILLPLTGAIACFVWPRKSIISGLTCIFGVLLCVAGLAWQLFSHGVYRHAVGGWGAPLGIDLYVDGLSLIMLIITALVATGISVYSSAYFKAEDAQRFWPVWLFLLAALNALFVSADLFNLYVTLELMALSAVTLSALSGTAPAYRGAMRYLLATLLGSLCYLLGVALLYHAYATVDIFLLAGKVVSSPVSWTAFGLISAGLALKTALFPLHFWLPSAHSSAPAPVSAVLSALVVKASFYILLRLWLEIFAPISGHSAQLFALLGSLAVIWGSIQALRQTRLKLLIAYSTVAQIGYLFLAFPLAANNHAIWMAALYLALSHALAKSAMFLAAGNLLHYGGHDRISDLDRVVQRLPLTAAAFALAGVSIMGLPPSGGFIGKWLLLESALTQGRWDLVLVLILGGLLAAAYIFKVLGRTFTRATIMHEAKTVPASMQWPALLLAMTSILLGFIAMPIFSMIGIGDAFSIHGGGP
jgi:formate hydrogenlyase subunit 3/multisubunit Na+/H+ antiporter MnhD subunit